MGSLVGKRVRAKPPEFFDAIYNLGSRELGHQIAARLGIVLEDTIHNLRIRFLDSDEEHTYSWRPPSPNSWFIIDEDNIVCENDE